MKKFLRLLLPLFLVVGCDDKEILHPPASKMRYTELNNMPVNFRQQVSFDIDGNNSKDLLFSTVLVADPIERVDKKRYFVTAAFDISLLVNNEQTPALNTGDAITINNPPVFNWYNANSIVLAEKIIKETGPDHWEGNWKNAVHKYLPVQTRINDLRYNGWVEISFNTGTGEMILHRAAIAIEAGKNIKAGQ
jgi:hypothetical protein